MFLGRRVVRAVLTVGEPHAATLRRYTALVDDSQQEANGRAPDVGEALARVRERIESACDRAGRRPGSVTMVAVTKYAAPEQVREAIRLGVGDFAENYVQNLQQRSAQMNEYHARLRQNEPDAPAAKELRWHLVGHLQRNKAKQAIPLISMMHTLDSLRLAEELDGQVPKVLGRDRRLAVLMQVNASGEGQKSGVAVGAARHLGEQVADMPHLRLMGLMTMAKYGDTEDEARRTFARCREVYEEMRKDGTGGEDFRHLSMGMSDDLEAGVLEGATILRVGSALFGKREEEPA